MALWALVGETEQVERKDEKCRIARTFMTMRLLQVVIT